MELPHSELNNHSNGLQPADAVSDMSRSPLGASPNPSDDAQTSNTMGNKRELATRNWDTNGSAGMSPMGSVAHVPMNNLPSSVGGPSSATNAPMTTNAMSLQPAVSAAPAMMPMGGASPLKSNAPTSSSLLGGNDMAPFSGSFSDGASAPTSFPLNVPGNFSDMIRQGNGMISSQPVSSLPSSLSAVPLGSTVPSSAGGTDLSALTVSTPQAAPTLPEEQQKSNKAADPRGVGEIGAASGLYMLSQSISDPKLKKEGEEEEKTVNGTSKDAAKRKRDDRGGKSMVNGDASPSKHGSETTRSLKRDAEHGTEDDEVHSDNDSDNDSKRKSFLERNRQAAFKCRQRKKAWLASLQAKVEYLQSDNESLQNTVEALRAEVLFLKSQLMQHHGHSAMDGDGKDVHADSNRSLSGPYSPMNVSVPSSFVGYPAQGNVSHPLLPNISPVPQVSHPPQPSMPQPGLDSTMSSVPATGALAAYATPGLPRMTQMPATQPMLSPYAQAPHGYAAARGND